MDIPYTVQPRPDTGIYNAKVGIWLFLASEVMLFGGLFSAYVFLRVGADRWPHGWLDVRFGTLNTIILALSAITTLLAWAACKVGQFGKFKFFHACTLLLALSFLSVKMYEYHDKWIHYEITLADGTFADGHLVEKSADFDLAKKTGTVTLHGRIVNVTKICSTICARRKTSSWMKSQFPQPTSLKWKNYGPWHNTFLAIYFTLTGLHALHILGGSIVIGYLFGGRAANVIRKSPNNSPTASEVSGLFWHFVGLGLVFCSRFFMFDLKIL